jgi:hypothetical protein
LKSYQAIYFLMRKDREVRTGGRFGVGWGGVGRGGVGWGGAGWGGGRGGGWGG